MRVIVFTPVRYRLTLLAFRRVITEFLERVEGELYRTVRLNTNLFIVLFVIAMVFGGRGFLNTGDRMVLNFSSRHCNSTFFVVFEAIWIFFHKSITLSP